MTEHLISALRVVPELERSSDLVERIALRAPSAGSGRRTARADDGAAAVSTSAGGFDTALQLLDEVDQLLSTLTLSMIASDRAERVRRVRDDVAGLVLAARTCVEAGAKPEAVARLLHRVSDATHELAHL